MNRQARQKGKYIMKKTFYKYTNKILVAMQLNTKKTNKNLRIKPPPYKYYFIQTKKAWRDEHLNRLFYLRSQLNIN